MTALIAIGLCLLPGCSNPLSTPTCTVGIAGTDLQVTATGGNAQSFCDSFIKSSNGHGYSTDQPDTSGTLMCQYTLSDGTVITVRDKGFLKAYGSAECQALASAVAS